MIGILLVTHGEIGKSLIDCASNILGNSINLLECIPVDPKSDIEECQKIIENEIKKLKAQVQDLSLQLLYMPGTGIEFLKAKEHFNSLT